MIWDTGVGEVDQARRDKSERFGIPLAYFEQLDAIAEPAMRSLEYVGLIPPWVAPEDAAEVFWQAWGYVSTVDRFTERHIWLGWLHRIGWAGRDGLPPFTQATTLYRGAHPSRRQGLSWTRDRGQAEAYAQGSHWSPGEQGRVWIAHCHPAAVLAGQAGGRRGTAGYYDEFLVDTSRVRIEPA